MIYYVLQFNDTKTFFTNLSEYYYQESFFKRDVFLKHTCNFHYAFKFKSIEECENFQYYSKQHFSIFKIDTKITKV